MQIRARQGGGAELIIENEMLRWEQLERGKFGVHHPEAFLSFLPPKTAKACCCRLSGVGVAGFEPTTPTTPKWCATGLRYTPNMLFAGASVLLVFPPPLLPRQVATVFWAGAASSAFSISTSAPRIARKSRRTSPEIEPETGPVELAGIAGASSVAKSVAGLGAGSVPGIVNSAVSPSAVGAKIASRSIVSKICRAPSIV